MNLSLENLRELCRVAIRAAQEAGKMISDCSATDIVVEEKATGESRAAQVVTEVDRKSQAIILKALAQTCTEYDLGLLAEESDDDHSRFEKEYFWCIDPLDGTLPFIEDRPGYAVSIALVSRAGVPQIGVVYDPRENVMYHAIKGGGAFRDQKKWELNQNVTGDHHMIDRGGAVMNAIWVLEEAPAYYYKRPKPTDGGGCLWDYAATACIFTELGAWASDTSGQPLDLNQKDSLFMNRKGVILASHEPIARDCISCA